MNDKPAIEVETEFMVMRHVHEPNEFAGLRIHQHVKRADIDLEKGVDTHTDCAIVVLDIDDIATIQHAIDEGYIPRVTPE